MVNQWQSGQVVAHWYRGGPILENVHRAKRLHFGHDLINAAREQIADRNGS